MAYDKDIDYQALINEAVGTGDYKSAAGYEQQRNAKIDGEGITDYETTNRFSGWLDDTDYSVLLNEAMDRGDSTQSVSDLYNKRMQKGVGTEGMEQYLNDDTAQRALEYMRNFGYSSTGEAPTYADKYKDQIDELTQQYIGRDPFSYDHGTDPLYGSYKKQYLREGDRAVQNAMGDYASMTGGIPSTAAMSAATQAGDYYATRLSDKIPELQQLAYQMYMNEGSEMRSQIGLLQGMSDSDYGRHRDSVGDWQYDRNFDYQKYMDDWNKSSYENERDYNREYTQQKDDYAKEQDQYAKDQDQYAKEWAEYARQQEEHAVQVDEAYRYYKTTGDPSWYYELVGRTPSWSSYGGGSGGGGSYSGGSGGGSYTAPANTEPSVNSYNQLSDHGKSMVNNLSKNVGGNATQGTAARASYIQEAKNSGKITKAEAEYMAKLIGV